MVEGEVYLLLRVQRTPFGKLRIDRDMRRQTMTNNDKHPSSPFWLRRDMQVVSIMSDLCMFMSISVYSEFVEGLVL